MLTLAVDGAAVVETKEARAESGCLAGLERTNERAANPFANSSEDKGCGRSIGSGCAAFSGRLIGGVKRELRPGLHWDIFSWFLGLRFLIHGWAVAHGRGSQWIIMDLYALRSGRLLEGGVSPNQEHFTLF